MPPLFYRLLPTAVVVSATLGLVTACSEPAPNTVTESQKQAIATVADIAALMYSDAHDKAQGLQQAVGSLLDEPNSETLAAAQKAYSAARIAYQPTEFMRFDEAFIKTSPETDGGLASVDAWEGQVNAWPLDEALIDYVASDYSGGKPDNGASIIASRSIVINGESRDTSVINKELLSSLNEIGGSEANVATGYHAIEFLLWGQDNSQAKGVAGQRPASDYAKGSACTNGNCDRRGEYLRAVTSLLVDDLAAMKAEWQAGAQVGGTGKTLRSDFLALSPEAATQRLFYGIGSIALGETASERMRVARISNSPEDEHDCFSDLSHSVYHANGLGIQAAYLGSYLTADGEKAAGNGLSRVVEAVDSETAVKVSMALNNAMSALEALRKSGDSGATFDYLIDGNDSEKLVVAAETALIEFTEVLELAAQKLGIRVDSNGGSLL